MGVNEEPIKMEVVPMHKDIHAEPEKFSAPADIESGNVGEGTLLQSTEENDIDHWSKTVRNDFMRKVFYILGRTPLRLSIHLTVCAICSAAVSNSTYSRIDIRSASCY
eukprot:GHVR01092494.1.p2 GENE.GHVR01092494.1~~GHVR01092494.1.p2  ORF type:complete len:108 (+),score=9.29 GHVR01092494.1:154-477(+)